MSNLPAFVLKDMTVIAGGDNRIGQVGEITVPMPKKTTEEMRNGGMIKPREVVMGYEATSCEFKECGFDPAMISLFAIGGDDLLQARGYLQSEDGSEHSVLIEMTARQLGIDLGTWQSGQKTDGTYSFTVDEFRVLINGEEKIAMDDFTARVDGVEQFPGRRDALGF